MPATQPPDSQTFPMQWAWRIALYLLPLLGASALVLGVAELSGLVPRGAWIGEASDAERWVCVAFGSVLLPFGLSALPHARLSIDDTHLRYLGFGVPCRTRTLALSDVRRWGHATARNQGRREPMLLLELKDLSSRSIKLAMYVRQQDVRDLLTARLGPATPASATMTGLRFDE